MSLVDISESQFAHLVTNFPELAPPGGFGTEGAATEAMRNCPAAVNRMVDPDDK
jgi:hypothetical protein